MTGRLRKSSCSRGEVRRERSPLPFSAAGPSPARLAASRSTPRWVQGPRHQWHNPQVSPEPVFVNLLRSPGIDSQHGGIDSSESNPGLHKRLQIRALGPDKVYVTGRGFQCPERERLNRQMSPGTRVRIYKSLRSPGIDSASLSSLAGRYEYNRQAT